MFCNHTIILLLSTSHNHRLFILKSSELCHQLSPFRLLLHSAKFDPAVCFRILLYLSIFCQYWATRSDGAVELLPSPAAAVSYVNLVRAPLRCLTDCVRWDGRTDFYPTGGRRRHCVRTDGPTPSARRLRVRPPPLCGKTRAPRPLPFIDALQRQLKTYMFLFSFDL